VALLTEACAALQRAMALGEVPAGCAHIARQIAIRVGDYDLLGRLSTFEAYGRGLAKAGMHGPLLQQLGRVESPEDRFEVLRQHRMWGELIEGAVARNPIKHPPPRPKDGRIRIGFMSSDLRSHPVAYFAFPLFQHIDPTRFDVYCYSFYTGAEDATQRYITSKVTAFRWHKSISARAAAQMIADDQLDILFELGGSTHLNRLEVMALRPAPVQVSWLGYPHSCGLSAIDYILCDPYIRPSDPALLIEKPFEVAESWVALGSVGFHDVPIEPGLPEDRAGRVTFGTLNNPYKYTPEMIGTWARVMAQVPDSRFLFVRPEGGTEIFRANLARLFAVHGIAAERLAFVPIRGKHLPHYNAIDISLDTAPHTGGTTTCETLWMGVPTVTLVGAAFFERLSYSNLTNAGLGDLCTFGPDDYVKVAVGLANDKPRRLALRHGLREQIRRMPLGMNDRWVENFQRQIETVLASHR
jgi:protein O-GlcNAc transferase